LGIGEIEHIANIEPGYLNEQMVELNEIFDTVRLTKKQKELLTFHYLSLKETYFLLQEILLSSLFFRLKFVTSF